MDERLDPVLARVRLLTRDGREVGTVRVPPFVKWPEIMVWEQRFFLKEEGEREGEPPYYLEGFVWWCPPGSEVETK